MSRKIVHVVGTGTIGEPLIGLLCDFKNQVGIDEVTFHNDDKFLRGKFQGITDSGHAQIQLNGKTEIFSSGMVTL